MTVTAIKIVRDNLKCGLKEAKDIVECLQHVTVLTSVANKIKEKCEKECGANVIVRSCKPPVGIIRGVDFSKGK